MNIKAESKILSNLLRELPEDDIQCIKKKIHIKNLTEQLETLRPTKVIKMAEHKTKKDETDFDRFYEHCVRELRNR